MTRDLIEHEEEEEKYAVSILKHKESFEKLQKYWFKFLALLIDEALSKHPKSLELRNLSSFIQRIKL